MARIIGQHDLGPVEARRPVHTAHLTGAHRADQLAASCAACGCGLLRAARDFDADAIQVFVLDAVDPFHQRLADGIRQQLADDHPQMLGQSQRIARGQDDARPLREQHRRRGVISQFGADVHAAGAVADDHHALTGIRLRAEVVFRVDDTPGEVVHAGEARHHRRAKASRGRDHRRVPVRAFTALHAPALPFGIDAVDGHAQMDVEAMIADVLRHILVILLAGGEQPVAQRESASRHMREKAGRIQPQRRIQAVPGGGDLVGLVDHFIREAGLLQIIGAGDARRPGSNDEHILGHDGRYSPPACAVAVAMTLSWTTVDSDSSVSGNASVSSVLRGRA
jgi:hypothetical protein